MSQKLYQLNKSCYIFLLENQYWLAQTNKEMYVCKTVCDLYLLNWIWKIKYVYTVIT